VPYGIKVWYPNGTGAISTVKGIVNGICYFDENPRYGNSYPIESVKPYLRPMSSMTEKEKKERDFYCGYKPYDENIGESYLTEYDMPDYIDFLYEHHLDFRGLIPMGLALEAPVDMYKFE
jgi:hypothetical protein